MSSSARLLVLMFIASYAPFAISDGYIPTVIGTMSRTNGMGAWAGGLALAMVLHRWAYIPVLLAFVMVNQWDCRSWAQSYRVQLEAIEAGTPEGVPKFIGSAPVFFEEWDWKFAKEAR